MNCLSINIRGIGGYGKASWIKKLKVDNGISFIGMQETMSSNILPGLVSAYWGGMGFDFDFVESIGNSGGILSVWDPKVFVKDKVTKDVNFLHVSGMIMAGNARVNVLNVYAPQDKGEKRLLWSKIDSLIGSNEGWWILFGDFNAVRDREERKNSKFDKTCASDFNSFIDRVGLHEYSQKGFRYTYMSCRKGRYTWSRIDRFLVCEGVFNRWPNAYVRVLNRNLSDHSPLVFSIVDTNFGPKPFRMFDSWLDRPGSSELINSVLESWVEHGPADINLLRKLAYLRSRLRDWFKDTSTAEKLEEITLRTEKEELDRMMETKDLEESDVWIWSECKVALESIELHKARDLRQKSRVKWTSLGDENSNFFHSVVNGRKAQNSIPGVLIDGAWVTKPSLVKREVFQFYRSLFKEHHTCRPKLLCSGIKKLDDEDRVSLVETFSRQEIKEAVFECGSNKAPGPDGFNFRFVKRFWRFFEEDFFNIMKEFHDKGVINQGCGSSFITLIPKVKSPMGLKDYRPITLIGMISKVISKILANRIKRVMGKIISEAQSAFLSDRFILDGPLMVNEILAWLNKRKKKAFLLKIDFEKAYDNVNWNFLLSIMSQMGFPQRWCDWIKGICVSSRAAVLVNGSPTFEFQCEKGLRQGDPLSPFLFLIVMEALSSILDKARDLEIFKGIQVGAKMTRIKSWDSVVDTIRNRLASWKVRHLSIGGRLILLKSVLESLPVYYLSLYKAPIAVLDSMETIMRRFLWAGPSLENKISWVAWDTVTTPMSKGGLGLSKIQEVNNALLLKWTWRFKKEGNSLWKKIILGCHGSSRPWSLLPCNASSSGCWKFIVKVGENKLPNGRSLNSFFVGTLGDGKCINFWGDNWLLVDPLRITYPNLFKLEKNKWAKVSDRINNLDGNKILTWEWRVEPHTHEQVSELFDLLQHLFDSVSHGGQDRWKWTKEKDGQFTVSSAKRLMSSNYVGDGSLGIKWKGWVPLKCKVLAWRIARNRIPTIAELLKRGVPFQQTDCRLCQGGLETTLHLFTGCSYSQEVWARVERWCNISHNLLFDIPDIFKIAESQALPKEPKHVLRGIIYTTIWMLWNERNERVFNDKKRQPIQLVENIKATAYFWIRNRSRWKSIDWKTWCNVPLD
ncbi:hypothetical protein SSX86_017085 [Deinandra increscens subsp. villosa]|uniref:Reverse transcriptase domain-containing protein n=1 Tax=Deinandra increscens subsp. villosa TaxID=3103831 RepID=A0AAP0CZ84_9ASTR